MEHVQRNVALDHAVDEAVYRALVIAGRKRRRQPQAVRPGRGQRRFSGQLGIVVQHFLQIGTADDIIF
ncbi:hypothetical protein D3C81_2303440 [compost metagenome]